MTNVCLLSDPDILWILGLESLLESGSCSGNVEPDVYAFDLAPMKIQC